MLSVEVCSLKGEHFGSALCKTIHDRDSILFLVRNGAWCSTIKVTITDTRVTHGQDGDEDEKNEDDYRKCSQRRGIAYR